MNSVRYRHLDARLREGPILFSFKSYAVFYVDLRIMVVRKLHNKQSINNSTNLRGNVVYLGYGKLNRECIREDRSDTT